MHVCVCVGFRGGGGGAWASGIGGTGWTSPLREPHKLLVTRRRLRMPHATPACSGARDFQEWFDFIGLVKDKRFPPTGSPFQMDFPPEAEAPGV